MVHISKKDGAPAPSSTLYARKLKVYRTDVVVEYGSRTDPPEPDAARRASVTELSRKSLQRLVFTVQNTDIEFMGMITLTYPAVYPENGREAKRHLNRFLSWLRSVDCGAYVWFLEFQKRGAPHFHILTERDMSDRKGDISARWYAAVGSNDEKHLRAGTRAEAIRETDGARRYAAKYGAKRDQKTVPARFSDVGRFWGCSRAVKPVMRQEFDVYGSEPADIARVLSAVGWQYSERLKELPLSVLYNAGKLFNEKTE